MKNSLGNINEVFSGKPWGNVYSCQFFIKNSYKMFFISGEKQLENINQVLEWNYRAVVVRKNCSSFQVKNSLWNINHLFRANSLQNWKVLKLLLKKCTKVQSVLLIRWKTAWRTPIIFGGKLCAKFKSCGIANKNSCTSCFSY